MRLLLMLLIFPAAAYAGETASVFRCHTDVFHLIYAEVPPVDDYLAVDLAVVREGDQHKSALKIKSLKNGETIEASSVLTEVRDVTPESLGPDQFERGMRNLSDFLGDETFLQVTNYKRYVVVVPDSGNNEIVGLQYFKGNDVVARLLSIPGKAVGVCD